ncbi:carbohydrate kinase family protein [Tumebacillus sp. ITR2]|uniref:Carbohydrate kinase family protein n=1 Tax=Tumebacillus amylolyticus TaxID=2801339 RepID=A0ABS1J6K3_9BACL|nr:carbohydrate kinase family protein [Tumebacillus amylolyticus]MBL0385699.1 carbohydrate kinase family protein [Tumebacillus amylolyticus]
MPQDILCIGAAHVDRKAGAKAEIQLGTSIPVSSHHTLGGVARNVAENLVRLHCPTALISRIGNDAAGNWVHAHSSDLGLDVTGLTRSPAQATASYTALLDPNGEMVLGLADMDIYDELTPDALDEIPDSLFERPLWFLDTNLPQATLQALLEKRSASTRIFVDPVSCPKAHKLLGLLNGIDFLFPNRDEAEILSGLQIRTEADLHRAAHLLHQRGVKNVLITLGESGVYVSGEELSSGTMFPALPASVADVTGAGDALIAGFLYSYGQTQSLEHAVETGIIAATLTIQSAETVHPDLSPALLDSLRTSN